MDYQFENLSHERFQEFCSSLVAREFPNVQVFPVGQPDGGRDSIVYHMNTSKKDFYVFQVKFVRNPYQINDVHKWLRDIIDKEVEKIAKLIPKGAKKYYLLTNVKGTAHSDVGSIDSVNKILEQHISIPALCWWRDDLCALLAKDPLFRWTYPEILNGQDMLNSLIFHGVNENKERREGIVKAYLVDQFIQDNEVKFRQIDLQNNLIELFTDVPIKVKKVNDKDVELKKIIQEFGLYNTIGSLFDEISDFDEIGSTGAAGFLLHAKTQKSVERVLIEGGPGQGKSTISQYLCQVHRMRLLNKQGDLALLPQRLREAPVRLPFKIDLRHIASWVEERNPYDGVLSEETFKKVWRNSLESFLIGHVLYHSHWDTFSSDDLHSILKASSVLFVFDGFDEIADLKIRKDVVDFINRGVSRIRENSKSIQIVITSRPAAFSDTIGFSVDDYPHFALADITQSTIDDYVKKWVKASGINNREASEIFRLVKEKLQLPHLRQLTRSPMQLAIFISLLRTRGESLPNKRTALYDSYIELFFNREAEKNSMIRDHRDLIIDIHQYLAWVLHSEAEMYGNSGSIAIDDLQGRLQAYLSKEGHQTTITSKLFHVMHERVCALVSRVQGTYEFEVQPLREYFCAKYLYNTSPYSPVGKEQRGTKPERFWVIARNYYWHNVVRFFAGCFDKGELPMLIEELNELQNDETLKFTNYPRLLTSQILSDFVFTQYPKLLSKVINIITDGINIGSIINQDIAASDSEVIVLPDACGRQEIFSQCFEHLSLFPQHNYANELIGIIRNNPINTTEVWQQYARSFSDEKLLKWLEYGYYLQIIHKIDIAILEHIILQGSDEIQIKKLQVVLSVGRLDVINCNPQIKQKVFNALLDGQLQVLFYRRKIQSALQSLNILIHPFIAREAIEQTTGLRSMSQFFLDYILRTPDATIMEFDVTDEVDIAIYGFSGELIPILEKPVSEWKNSITFWSELVEIARQKFGERWSLKILATVVVGIKSKDERFEGYENLTDERLSLCERVRCARMKSGNVSYWEEKIVSGSDLRFTLLVFFTWATSKVLHALRDVVAKKMCELSEQDLKIVHAALSKTVFNNRLSQTETKKLIANMSNENGLIIYGHFISVRFPSEIREKFVSEFDDNVSPLRNEFFHLKLSFMIRTFFMNNMNELALKDIKEYYSSVLTHSADSILSISDFDLSRVEMPIVLAKEIMSDVKAYPKVLASVAEKTCRLHANATVIPVGKIAADREWFF